MAQTILKGKYDDQLTDAMEIKFAKLMYLRILQLLGDVSSLLHFSSLCCLFCADSAFSCFTAQRQQDWCRMV